MPTKIANWVVKHPWLIIVFFIGITAAFASQLPKTEIDPSVKNMLPPELEARVNIDRIEDLFGGTDMVMVVLSADDVLATDTLRRVKKISKKIDRIKEIDRVLSVFELKDIQGQDGQMIVDPAVKRIPKSDEQREKLREKLKDNELVYGSVVSKDFKHMAVVGLMNMKATDEGVLKEVDKVLAEAPGPEPIYIGGMPFTRKNISADIRGDMQKFMPVGLLVMLVFLFIAFRQLRGVLLPFIVTVMGIIVSVGLIPILGWKIQMVTVILPVILIAVANDYGIHMLARYQEENSPDSEKDSKQLAKNGIIALARPVLATGITTIAGLLCLLSHIIIPAKQMGILASAGVAFALLGSLLFIPAVLSVLPKAKPIVEDHRKKDAKRSLLERLLHHVAGFVGQRPRAILTGILVLVMVVSTGIYFLKIDTNPINYYEEGSPIRISNEIINDHFGGSSSVGIVAEGDIKSPEIMKKIDDLEKFLERHPNIDITASISKVVREMNEVMHDEDPAFDKIPESRDAIAQYFLLYSTSGEPDDFDRLVDFPYEHAQITARINEYSTDTMKAVVDAVRSYIKMVPDSPFTIVGGFADLFSDLVDRVVQGQLTSLALSLLLVGILVGLLFRSFVAGIMAVFPLALAMALLFGLMGYLNIELNIATAMLSSIMIGVGVDYTIHFLWRYKDERAKGAERVEAVQTTLLTSGRGIVFNALSVVIGFAVLMLSAFLPVKFFGILVVVSISACLIGALVLLPAISLIFKPKFLEPKDKHPGC